MSKQPQEQDHFTTLSQAKIIQIPKDDDDDYSNNDLYMFSPNDPYFLLVKIEDDDSWEYLELPPIDFWEN